jgi:hypothetical protein
VGKRRPASRPACKADSLTAIWESVVQKMWEPQRSVTGIVLPFLSYGVCLNLTTKVSFESLTTNMMYENTVPQKVSFKKSSVMPGV